MEGGVGGGDVEGHVEVCHWSVAQCFINNNNNPNDVNNYLTVWYNVAARSPAARIAAVTWQLIPNPIWTEHV